MPAYENLDQQFIAGQWLVGSSKQKIDNINPFTQQNIFSYQAANTQDVDQAYQAAQQCFDQGILQSAELRIQILNQLTQIIAQRREEILTWLIQESGSTRLKANIEIDATLAIIQESTRFPQQMLAKELVSLDPQVKSIVLRQSIGVITVISPWNFPFHLSMRSVVTALACGNSVVLKPASDTPVTGGTLLAALFAEAGLIHGALNIIIGAGSEIGDYVVEHPLSKMISFTGSTEVGKHVAQKAMAATSLKRLALELGGNAPLVILDDADLDLAVELTILGRFLHQGQICMSTNRVIVDASIYDQYLEKLLLNVAKIQVGDPNLAQTLIGPIINPTQVKKLQHIIDLALSEGAQLVYAGGIQDNLVYPHVFIDVDPQSSLAQNESFGPILPVLKAKNEAHALDLANNSRFGLSSAVCTRHLVRGKAFAAKLEVGMTHINRISVADHANAPFGGEKNSGLGRFNGNWIFEEFTRTQWLTTALEGNT